MLGTAFAQLRVAGSVALGLPIPPWALNCLVGAALATQHEFGTIALDGAELVSGPVLDEAARRAMHERRFRALARRAQRETTYYQQLFARIGLDATRLSYPDITSVPCTSKSALRDRLDAFVPRQARPVLVASTTGSTGRPVQVAFSRRELVVQAALSALGFLLSNELYPEDVVYLGVVGHGMALLTLLAAGERIGATCIPGGLLPPRATLECLSRPLRLPGKKARPNVVQAAPSSLGELVEAGLELGFGPRDFGLDRILTGGETLTAGLRARLPALFGDVAVVEAYGVTETFGSGGQVCAAGHVHFHPAHALVEVISPDADTPVEPGEVGTLIVTPLPPFRETTLLLRYDTEDLVRALPESPSCELRSLPAVSQLLGKRALSIRHADGWTTPRDLLEALEALEDVPLPARCGMWTAAGGVAVEVMVRTDTPVVRRRVTASLESRGVPLRELHLVDDRASLRRPLPLRCDLQAREHGGQMREPQVARARMPVESA